MGRRTARSKFKKPSYSNALPDHENYAQRLLQEIHRRGKVCDRRPQESLRLKDLESANTEHSNFVRGEPSHNNAIRDDQI